MSYRETEKLQKKTLETLEKVKQILSSGSKTIRRIFYMVASGSYNSLVKLLVWARLHDEIDWSDVVEEGRHLTGNQTYEDVEDFIGNAPDSYVKSKTSSFKQYFEVWLEKATLQRIFSPITNKYDVGLLVTRGQISWTALKDASERLDSNSVIIYFGDNDYYGNRMFDQIQEFLSDLGCNPAFIKPALTDEQEQEFDFPQGEHHLDGMPEDELRKLLEATIKEHINMDDFNDILKEEDQDIQKLRDLFEENEM